MLAHYSWPWDLPWRVADRYSLTLNCKNRTYQLQISSWLEAGICVYFLFSVLGFVWFYPVHIPCTSWTFHNLLYIKMDSPHPTPRHRHTHSHTPSHLLRSFSMKQLGDFNFQASWAFFYFGKWCKYKQDVKICKISTRMKREGVDKFSWLTWLLKWPQKIYL